MLDFIIVSLPRSGSTWAANWLTTDKTYCAHDPLNTMHYRDFDKRVCEDASGRKAGIACTASGWLWPEWINAHPAPKLVLRRKQWAVNKSLKKICRPELPWNAERKLDEVRGWHIPYADLFHAEKAQAIWERLIGPTFDPAWHRRLAQIRVEPQFDSLVIDRQVEARLVREVS